jgi:Zn-dependent M16 (insulinase) family peptidase
MSKSPPRPFARILRACGLSLLGTSVAMAALASPSQAAGRATGRIRSARGSFGLSGAGPGKTAPRAVDASIDLSKLTQGEIVNGFRTDAVYLNDAGSPVGARFKHVRSAFTFDYLCVQTAPQAFIWVNTPPTSDMGEAHTQEHLLLGKGNKGRSVATLENMSMTSSTAMTMQWRTCYHFNTTAGPDVFYEQVQTRLDALLHPDYTDEEVAREVRNFGVSKDAKDGLLKLEEKGTVYNEMVSASKTPNNPVWRAQNATLYGKEHPLYFMSGGTPEGLRKLNSADIRAFREKHYLLPNMGMIAALPKNMAPASVLEHIDKILSDLQPTPVATSQLNVSDIPVFPPPRPVAKADIEIVDFPEDDSEKPGSIECYWPADLDVSPDEEMLLGLFLGNLAGDPATPLYKKFIDTKTRYRDLGATGVWASYSDEIGFPISIGLSSVGKSHINVETIAEVRELIQKELQKIAAWKDDSPELAAFNERLRDRLIATRRSYCKFVNSPPGFGNRRQGAGWMGLFQTIGRSGEFYRSVTMKPEITFAAKQLDRKGNIWAEYLKKWHLTEVTPFAIANKPEPQLLVVEEKARKERLTQEVERLKKVYGTTDEQAALAAYKADYDKATAQLDDLAKQDKPAKLVASLPLTMDDPLEYSVSKLDGVPLVASTFENMTGATAGLALRVDSVPEEDLLYLSFLPTLLNQVGLIVDGKPITYDQMLDLFRREILSAGCTLTSNTMTNRCELVMRGSGNDPAEVDKAIVWMGRMLQNPDWRVENLPRIRDVIDQTLTSLRNSRQVGYEDSWVNSVSAGYWRQDWPLYLSTRCFLTRIHSAQRLRWQLKGDLPAETINNFVAFMSKLAQCGLTAKYDDLKATLELLQVTGDSAKTTVKAAAEAAPTKSTEPVDPALAVLVHDFGKASPEVAKLIAAAAKDLSQDLVEIPDANFKGDWSALCAEISADVQIAPAKTLARLDKVRKLILTTSGARLFVIGADATQKSMQAPLQKLLKDVGSAPFIKAQYSSEPVVIARMRERYKDLQKPAYVGFVNANTKQGVFLLSAPALKYTDTDEESLLRYLALVQYGGSGAHSMFMKTWAAGLAYSNGLRSGPNERMSYYADKTPALPETIRFVTQQLKEAPKDADFSEYAIACVFSSMAAQRYESRGESIAEALVDNEPPEMVRKFRQAILNLRDKPNLAAALHERLLPQCARLFPGLGLKAEDVPGSVYMVIGDDKQMELYEQYLKSVVGADVRLYRVYSRDFWMFNGQ